MKTEWREELCSEYPKQFQKLNPTTYIQRKNIRKMESKEGEMGFLGYICESRIISNEVYEAFMDDMNAPSQMEIREKLQKVEESQDLADSNNLVIMSAIADLYEALTALYGPI